MEENKELVVARLLDTLKVCRAYQNIVDMKYVEEPNGDEKVVVYVCYRNEYKETLNINVTADSNMAIIKDVYDYLYSYFG